MLNLFLYNSIDDVYKQQWMRPSQSSVIFVCPKPSVADNLRANLLKDPSSTLVDIPVVTISKFVSDEFKKYFDMEKYGPMIVSKSQLYMYLGSVFQQKFPNLSFEIFNQAFNLFTSFRSYTLNVDLINEVLGEYDEQLSQSIKVFWLILETMGLIDEQKMYALLSDVYKNQAERSEGDEASEGAEGADGDRGEKEDSERIIVLWGFSQITSMQIDFIRSISSFDKIYIPFPDSTYKKSISSDWIRHLPFDEIVQLQSPHHFSDKLRILKFPSGRLNEYVAFLYETLMKEAQNDRDDSSYKKGQRYFWDLYLLEKNPTHQHMAEMPIEGLFFKSEVDLFAVQMDLLFQECVTYFFKDKEAEVSVQEITEFLLLKAKNLLLSKNANFPMVKCIHTLKEKILLWNELSSSNMFINMFNINLLFSIANLDLPRVFYTPLICDQIKGRIRGMDSLDGFERENINVLCASKNYSSLLNYHQRYEEPVLELLRVLGPIPRSDFDFQIYKSRIVDILRHENAYLLLEEDLDLADAGVGQILEEFKYYEMLPYLRKIKSDIKKDNLHLEISEVPCMKTLSASRMQAYIDCPRQYYFNYHTEYTRLVSYKSDLVSSQLGTLEHQLIREYLISIEKRNLQDLRHDAKILLDQYLKQEHISLTWYQYDNYLAEIANYVTNALRPLMKMKSVDEQIEFFPEAHLDRELKKISAVGSIDLIIKSSLGNGLLDFKRSESSVPAVGEIKNLEKIQLAFYLANGSLKLDHYNFFGYICLADIEKSVVFFDTEDDFNKFKKDEIFGDKNLSKRIYGVADLINSYLPFQEEIIEKMINDREFKASPRSPEVCNYCKVRLFCSRGQE